MSRSTTAPDIRRRAMRAWLLAVAAMIFALVLVGGATRLTESGLSIVEWKPVTGTLPPLSAGDWETEFEKYKSIPQYQQLNRGMSLDEFKTIYWWEWTHRLLGRLVGVVFLLPFLCFLWMGWVEPGWRLRLWTIFGLGAAQGAVGWWMVASGLAERVSVSQYRLAFHLTLACLILAATLWTAQRLLPQPAPLPDVGTKRLRASAIGLVVLVLCQIYLGAIVAGLRAGLIYNTWPLIDGSFVPDAARLFVQDPWWCNLFENTLTAQFFHRTVAYLLWLAAIIHAVYVARTLKSGQAVMLATALAIAVTIQALLGILTLLHVVPIGLALAHQATAILVLALAVVHAERLSPRTSSMPLGQPLAGAT
jgi:cytochrome c oxidase assembly protein subunit 15